MDIGVPPLDKLEELYNSITSLDLHMYSNPIQYEYSEASISHRFPQYSDDETHRSLQTENEYYN